MYKKFTKALFLLITVATLIVNRNIKAAYCGPCQQHVAYQVNDKLFTWVGCKFDQQSINQLISLRDDGQPTGFCNYFIQYHNDCYSGCKLTYQPEQAQYLHATTRVIKKEWVDSIIMNYQQCQGHQAANAYTQQANLWVRNTVKSGAQFNFGIQGLEIFPDNFVATLSELKIVVLIHPTAVTYFQAISDSTPFGTTPNRYHISLGSIRKNDGSNFTWQEWQDIRSGFSASCNHIMAMPNNPISRALCQTFVVNSLYCPFSILDTILPR